MTVLDVVLWTGTLLLIAVAITAAALATSLRRPALALIALLPVGVGIVVAAAHLGVAAPHPVFAVLAALGLAALGIIGGSPLTMFVLALASSGAEADAGSHGGILIAKEGSRTRREVLRGGAVVGYLERAAIVGAVAIGHLEVVAAIIAIKGLGRFSELDSAEARERFIIGTLTSMIWAGTCAALILL